MNHRYLAVVATAGPPLFAALTILAALVKPGYDTAEQTVSDLAVGEYGWIQTANFLILGAAMLAFVMFAGDVGDPLHDVAGLIERVVIAIPLVWISVSAVKQLNAVAPGIRRVEAANAR